MKIIIPMAGKGKRMRPHTLTIPKPLIPIAGKPIILRLIEELSQKSNLKIQEIAYIIRHPEQKIEKILITLAKKLNTKAQIYYQHEALGTAHAIYCARESLKDQVIIAFADTLFFADFKIHNNYDGIIWVHKVKNPSLYGVVKIDNNNIITDFIEKPKKFVSNLAVIGIYYFKQGEKLLEEIKYLIENNIKINDEYQITNALENMKNKGHKLCIGKVDEWLDCGNKDTTIYANQRILTKMKPNELISTTARTENSIIVPPSYIGENVKIKNSIIGPYVSIGANTLVINSLIKNSIIQSYSTIEDLTIQNSMIGNYVDIKGKISELSIGDYTSIRSR